MKKLKVKEIAELLRQETKPSPDSFYSCLAAGAADAIEALISACDEHDLVNTALRKRLREVQSNLSACEDALAKREKELLKCKENSLKYEEDAYKFWSIQRDVGTRINHQTISQYSEMLAVLQDVSGNVANFTWDKMRSMSAACFLNTLAPNMHITFTSRKEKK